MTRSGRVSANHGWRLKILRLGLVLFALILVGRLFILQVFQYGHYAALASVRHDISSVLTPERGAILARDLSQGSQAENYYPVAVNKKVEHLVVSPYDLEDGESAAGVLEGLLSLDKAKLTEGLAQKERRYWVVKKELSEAKSAAIAEAKKTGRLPKKGVWIESETKRHYPEAEFLSHTLGFMGYVGEEKKGIYGLEAKFEEVLAGRPGALEAARDAAGGLINTSFRKLVPAVNGSDLRLTVDRAIQTEAQRVLKDYVTKFSAAGGSVVVIDPKTGGILALASEPAFNIKEFNKVKDATIFNNPATGARYEPGSVIKPLTMAAALDSGRVKPDDTYEDTGALVFDGYTIRNADDKTYGRQDTTGILEKSINTGAVYLQRQTGKETFKRYLKKFGLDEKTGITLPGEIAGDLRNLNTKSDIAYATAAFGQGISVTPLGLATAYLALAGNGEIKRPHIVSEIQHPDGAREVVQPETLRQVISPETAAIVKNMMVQVVEKGFGKKAGVKGYYIAGKTGTAQIPLTDGRGYDPNKSIMTFSGFGPVENPAFVMVVKIDKPAARFAESTAAPAFGEIAKFILNYLQIPPTRPIE